VFFWERTFQNVLSKAIQQMVTGVLSDTYLINFEDPEAQIVAGTVVSQISQRYSPSNWFVTSQIVDILTISDDVHIILTQNSIYQIDAYTEIFLPWECLTALHSGVSPISLLKSMNQSFHLTKDCE
jgi:hypothetical protein